MSSKNIGSEVITKIVIPKIQLIYKITRTRFLLSTNASEKKSYNIEIEAVSTDESRIDTDYIYANDLGAGQSQEFEIFTYVDDADLEAMQSATFEIIEASMY